jgi:hypothetical protein
MAIAPSRLVGFALVGLVAPGCHPPICQRVAVTETRLECIDATVTRQQTEQRQLLDSVAEVRSALDIHLRSGERPIAPSGPIRITCSSPEGPTADHSELLRAFGDLRHDVDSFERRVDAKLDAARPCSCNVRCPSTPPIPAATPPAVRIVHYLGLDGAAYRAVPDPYVALRLMRMEANLSEIMRGLADRQPKGPDGGSSSTGPCDPSGEAVRRQRECALVQEDQGVFRRPGW